MDREKLWMAADSEADWLRYYGYAYRDVETFHDVNFYDRMVSMKLGRREIPLYMRCARGFITGPKPVLDCTPEELVETSGPKNHDNNVYTPLEYFIGRKEKSDELINKIKNAR